MINLHTDNIFDENNDKELEEKIHAANKIRFDELKNELIRTADETKRPKDKTDKSYWERVSTKFVSLFKIDYSKI